jgi:hypothetical protein
LASENERELLDPAGRRAETLREELARERQVANQARTDCHKAQLRLEGLGSAWEEAAEQARDSGQGAIQVSKAFPPGRAAEAARRTGPGPAEAGKPDPRGNGTGRRAPELARNAKSWANACRTDESAPAHHSSSSSIPSSKSLSLSDT